MPQPREKSKFILSLPFGLSRPSTDWMDACHIGRESTLLNLLIQMLISSGNTLTDTYRNNVLPAIWASLSAVELT